MASPALIFAGASAGLDALSGLFGYLASEDQAAVSESRGRMLRLEAETEAQRYGEQAETFRATQALSYLKSGVQLTGSPLDVLDETARRAAEDISAIRAQGLASQVEQENLGREARARGRMALVGGLLGGQGKVLSAGFARARYA